MLKFLVDRDTWQEIYDSLSKNKFRTIITMIGVWWGILLLIGLLGSARGMENSFNKLFGDFATNSVFVWAQNTAKPFKGFQEGRRIQLKLRDAEIIAKEVKGIEFMVPRNMGNALVVRSFQSGNYGVYGDYPLLDKVQKKNMKYGRFINQIDINEKRKIAVISEDIYKQLFEKDEDPIGQYVQLNSINFKVAGVFKVGMGGGGPQGDIHIPFTTFQQIYNTGNNMGWMMITGKPEYSIKQIEKDAKLILKNLHKVHPKDKRAFGSFNLGKMFSKLTGFLTGMQFLTWFVGIATLIAGVLQLEISY